MNHLEKYEFQKLAATGPSDAQRQLAQEKALLSLLSDAAGGVGIGSIMGAANAPEGLGIQGMARGTGIGLTSGLGANIGGLLGGSLAAPFLIDKLRQNDSGAIGKLMLANLLGKGLGAYGGYRAGKNLMWFDDDKKKKKKKKK